MNSFDVNTDELVKLTNRLEKLHRSDFPIAVRNTLNDAAFDVKKNTLIQESRKLFITRKPSFFRAFSRVDKATGFSVKSMHSTVGMLDSNTSTRNLAIQEKGGTINDRDLIPTDAARTGKQNQKPISKKAYLNKIKVVDSSKSKARTNKQKFVRAAIIAASKYGQDGHVLTENSLVRIDGVFGNIKSGRLVIKTKKIYDFSPGRKVKISKKPFLSNAGKESAKKLPNFYKLQAEKRIKKALEL